MMAYLLRIFIEKTGSIYINVGRESILITILVVKIVASLIILPLATLN